MTFRNALFCSAIMAAAALANTHAYAQDAAPARAAQASAGPADVEEVVVTARRREEDIQKIPLSVTALSAEALAQRVVTRAPELARLTPGLEVNPSSSARRSDGNFAIRGQGGSPFAGGTGVGIYFAEVPTIFTPNFLDLQNAQVLKGPQGTLFGRVTTGGAVLLTPKAPGNEFEGAIRARYGQYGARLTEFAVGGPISGDVLSARLAGQLRASDGFTDNLFHSRTADGYSVDAFRLSIRFKPADRIQNDTILGVRTSKEAYGSRQLEIVVPFGAVNASTGATSGTIRPIPASVAALNGIACPAGVCPTWLNVVQQQQASELALGKGVTYDNMNMDPSTNRDTSIINTTRFDLTDNITLKNIASYARIQIRSAGEYGNDSSSLPIHEGYNPAGSIINTGPGDHIVTEELQLQADLFDNRLQFTGGGYFEQSWSDNFARTLSGLYAGFGSSVPTPGATPTAAQTAAYNACLSHRFSEVNSGYCHDYTGQTIIIGKPFNRDYATYAQAQFQVTDKLRVTGGVRETWSTRKALSARLTSTGAGLTNLGSSTVLTGIPAFQVRLAGNPIAFAFPSPSEQLPGANLLYQKISFQKFTWMGAADYNINDNLFLYGTVRTGYKPGGFNSSGVPAAFAQFGPETVTDYELGLKGNWSVGGVSGRSSLDVYWDNYQDIQRTILVVLGGGVGTTTVTTNAAAATIKGLEFDTTVRFGEWLDVHGFYALTDAKYKTWQNTGQFLSNGVPATADLTRNLLSDTSKHRWAVQPTLHVVPVPQEIGKLDLSANIYFQGKHAVNDLNASFAPSNIVKGATKADLRAELSGINGGGLSAAVGVTNVTNKRNKIGTIYLVNFEGIGVVQYAEPRMWYVEAAYKF